MNEVFEKTRELAQAVMRSDEYTTMKEAEDVAMKNEAAAAIMAEYLERKQQLEEIMSREDADPLAMTRLSEKMEDLQKQLQATPDIIRLTKARENFTRLISQINQVLRFTITGDMGEEESTAGNAAECTGSCATCPGCH